MQLVDTLSRDFKFYSRLVGVLRGGPIKDRHGPETFADVFEQICERHAARTAFIFEGNHLTYRELGELANRFAHWGHGAGLKPGDTIGLFMENRPEFLAAWAGLSKIGVSTALINTSLTGDALAHCLKIVDAKHLLFGAELKDLVEQSIEALPEDLPRTSEGGASVGAADLTAGMHDLPGTNPPAAWRAGAKASDPLIFIYTSGTTGLPKAVKASHHRAAQGLNLFRFITNVKKDGRLYTTLPLYHATGLVATCAALNLGAATVLRRKFSASHFWQDCVENEVTAFIYIGELMRFLVNAPESKFEKMHTVTSCGGNGMRPDVWPEFEKRFGIKDIVEFYGATEANFILLNLDGKQGAIGRHPNFMRKSTGFNIVEFDVDEEIPIRTAEGRCIPCAPGKVGEAIAQIQDPDKAKIPFEGYTNRRETEDKVLRDVFEPGDAYYRSGDLMRYDEKNYVYFVDRIGDTFRWKGENVATTQVQEVLSQYPGVEEAVVYGVQVPHADGRAGMAALMVTPEFDINGLGAFIEPLLPRFARPVFIRMVDQVKKTGTHKVMKAPLKREGFDPRAITGGVYVLEGNLYRSLTGNDMAAIQNGEMRL